MGDNSKFLLDSGKEIKPWSTRPSPWILLVLAMLAAGLWVTPQIAHWLFVDLGPEDTHAYHHAADKRH